MSAPLPEIRVRAEAPGDAARIRLVNELAFGGTVEADLIDALRAAGGTTLSMVAVTGGDPALEEETRTDKSGWGAETEGLGASAVGGAVRGEMVGGQMVGGEIVGHALVTPVIATTDRGEVPLLGLGPVAVLPTEQHQGIGTFLIETILEQSRAHGHAGIVVVGEPEYYRRFGFIPGDRWNLKLDMDVPEDAFMVLELSPGTLAGLSGVVRYRPEFNQDPGL